MPVRPILTDDGMKKMTTIAYAYAQNIQRDSLNRAGQVGYTNAYTFLLYTYTQKDAGFSIKKKYNRKHAARLKL